MEAFLGSVAEIDEIGLQIVLLAVRRGDFELADRLGGEFAGESAVCGAADGRSELGAAVEITVAGIRFAAASLREFFNNV